MWEKCTHIQKHTDISQNTLTHTHSNTHPHLHRICSINYLPNLLTNRNTHTKHKNKLLSSSHTVTVIRIGSLKISNAHTHTHTHWTVLRHGRGCVSLLSTTTQNRPLLTLTDRESKTIRKSPSKLQTHTHTHTHCMTDIVR